MRGGQSWAEGEALGLGVGEVVWWVVFWRLGVCERVVEGWRVVIKDDLPPKTRIHLSDLVHNLLMREDARSIGSKA